MSEANLNRKFIECAKLLNIYLNHFPRHERYVLSSRIRNTAYELYDLISEGQKRYQKKTTLTSLDICHERLRTWQSRRFIRKHSMFKFRHYVKKGRMEGIVSILGHALKTTSLPYLLRIIKEASHGKNLQLPASVRRLYNVPCPG